MKKVKVDQKKRQTLLKNFKALAFLSIFLLPFSLGKAAKPALEAERSEKVTAVWG
jgi:hypothetical protein